MLRFIKRPPVLCFNIATLLFALSSLLVITPSAIAQLQFNFVDEDGNAAESSVDPLAVAGFEAAADRWSSVFDDDITVNIQVVFESIPEDAQTGATILGSAGSSIIDSVAELGGAFPTFSLLSDSLASDATSANDQIAVANLPNGSSATFDDGSPAFANGSPVTALSFQTNDREGNIVFDNDTEIGDGASVGNNNVLFGITSANAKALGLIEGDSVGIDAQITFNSDITFDFDPTDGITDGAFDFVGIATHELGHALGVVSGVDLVDSFTGEGPNDEIDINGAAAGIGELDNFALFSTFDLFRRSESAFTQDPDALDLSTGDGVFFSIDGVLGDGNDLPLETGVANGSGQQASHLADNLGLGILDPTVAPGELLAITDNDILLLDVIGFDVVGTAVPEPSSLAVLFSLGSLSLIQRRRR